MIWQDHLRKTLLAMKFKESVTRPGVFQHQTRDIFLCVHVDDLLCTGLRDGVTWLKKQVQKEYELETLLMEKMVTWSRKPSISGDHWNGESRVSEFDRSKTCAFTAAGIGGGQLSEYVHATESHSGEGK